MKIVAISGNAGAGKDTAADRLVSNHGYVRISLADPIKRFGKDVFNFSPTQLWGPSDARNQHDRRYNHYSEGQDIDAAWKAAYVRLEQQADDWIDEVLGYEGAHNNKAYLDSLLSWFHKLGSEHSKLSPRVMLQTLGTEWGRSVDPDIWVNYCMRTAYKVLAGEGVVGYHQAKGLFIHSTESPAPKGIVVADVRFLNEIEALKTVKSFLVRVRRDDVDDAALRLGIRNHQSEAEQQTVSDEVFNMIINNNGSLEKLMDAVDMIPRVAKG